MHKVRDFRDTVGFMEFVHNLKKYMGVAFGVEISVLMHGGKLDFPGMVVEGMIMS